MATTRERWVDFEEIYYPTRGPENVPAAFLRGVQWRYEDGHHGYFARDEFGAYVKVEFDFAHLCWVEVRWNEREARWIGFRPACNVHYRRTPDLGWELTRGGTGDGLA